MKKEIKGFLIGFISALILTGGAFAANSIMAEIYPDNVTIVANTEKVNDSNFTYNNKTYAPIRSIAEQLDCLVIYDDKKKQVDVMNKYFKDGTKINANETVTDFEPVWYINEGNNDFDLGAYFHDDVLETLGIIVSYDEDSDTFYLVNPYLYESLGVEIPEKR